MLNYILQNEFKLYYCFKTCFLKSKPLRQTAVKQGEEKSTVSVESEKKQTAENK